MNIFELFGTIAIDAKGANKAIDATGKNAQTLQAKMGKAFTKIGKDAVACGKAIAKGMAVVGAAGAAITAALVKSSVTAYAEFEQLQGGVKKLFGEDVAHTVMDNANKAFKTAGLSANKYMEQVTSFSASLISGLGGDTEAAALLADKAIVDMADNANTFGTDITAIQNAYQGFAKQNYTMLDNLKLGYGGTAEEMARLINDSGVLGKSFKATAKNVNDVSFAKIIEAIHVIQSNMGIAEATIKEADTTISGSFAAWKASWTNLMSGLGDEENVEPLVDAFFEAGNTVLKNLAKVLPKIGRNIKAAMQTAGIHIRQAWEQNIWPTVQKFAIKFGIELPDWSVVDSSLSSWWEGTGKPAVENIKEFFSDISAWVSEHKEEINGFLFALGGALLLLNAPLLLIVAGLFLVAANWKKVKSWAEKAKLAMDEFFGQTIPQAWKDMVSSVQTWINDHIIDPILTAIGKLEAFLGMDANKFVTVTTHYTTTGDVYGGGVGGRFGKYTEPIGPELPAENTETPAPGAASGLRYVPYDNYAVRLHMGETVLPRNEAEEYRSGRAGSMEVAGLKEEIRALSDRVAGFMQQITANTAAGHQVVLDSGLLVGSLTPQIDAQMGTLTMRKQRRNL